MTEREGGEGIEDSSWVVGPDGITFHDLPDLDAMLDEELKGRAAIRSLIDSRSIAELLRELGRDVESHPF